MDRETTVPSLKTDNLSADIWGALAAMLVAMPSSIAFGVAIYTVLGPDYVAQGALAGILGAVAMGILAPVVGGTPRLISAPCAPAAAVMAALAAELIAGGGNSPGIAPQQIPLLLTFVALISGALQFLYGTIGGGRLIKYIPYPVVSGYLSAVAVLIFLNQIPKFLGVPAELSLWNALRTPGNWQWPALIVGGMTMAGMALAPRITRMVPAPILGLAAGLATYFALASYDAGLLDLRHNSLVVGVLGGMGGSFSDQFAGRWTSFRDIRLGDLGPLLIPALTLSALLSMFLIRRGIVRILLPLESGRHLNLATFARGNFFGDMAFLDRGVRSADAMSVTPTDLYVISRRRFDELARAHPLVGVKMFARLARALAVRLRYTDNELRALQES